MPKLPNKTPNKRPKKMPNQNPNKPVKAPGKKVGSRTSGIDRPATVLERPKKRKGLPMKPMKDNNI
jgi:hypothetical protein